MANWKWFGKAHAAIYKCSKGRVGARMGGIDIVLIDTIGRKTGMTRTVPIACYPYQDSVVVVASNNGLPKDPVWWINLRSHPEVEVQLGAERYIVIAEQLSSAQKEAVWPDIIRINPRQKGYAKIAGRDLPVIYLKRKLV